MSPKGIASAGQRSVLVTIQGLAESDGGYPVETFTDLPPAVYMSKNIGRRLETEDFEATAAQVAARMQTEWQMPYRVDMDPDLIDVPKMRRLKDGVRTYDIVGAEKLGPTIRIATVAATKV
jgi:hypothetical protein